MKLLLHPLRFVLVLLSFQCLVLLAESTNSFKVAVSIDRTNGRPAIRVSGGTNENVVFHLESSSDLTNWMLEGVFPGALAPYPDLSSAERGSRYYRVIEYPFSPTNNWSNQLRLRGPTKFIISFDQPDRVYFHNGFTFHYQFARQSLPNLPSDTPEHFDEAVLYPSKQKAVIGGIYFPPTGMEFGLEFVSAEPFPPSRLAHLFKTVAARIYLPGSSPFLLPSGPQRAAILSNVDYFRSNGVPVREFTEFATNSLVHSEGWIIGTLKYIPATELDAAIAAGFLTPETILVTDATPRDLPPIAGLISLVPSSPNSHTVLRLQSAGLPYFDYPPANAAAVTNLSGKTVLFGTVNPPPFSSSSSPPHFPPSWGNAAIGAPVRLMELSTLEGSLRDELGARLTNSAVAIAAMERFGSYSTNTDALDPGHTCYFGSKAANFGVLRRSIPANSPPGIAFSFDLWLDFMAQILPTGKTLQQEIDERLAAIEANSALLNIKLEEVRDLIEDLAQFTPDQQAAITNALSVFDPSRKIRFRSSSNAEDLPRFSAAGLYESYSGCLLDDLIPTPEDTCRCDPLDDKRRSVFRAIRKVFASFYNEQAFLERRQFGIEEDKVGMAILVHHSFPDEIELANGIANVDFQSFDFDPGRRIQEFSIVSQRGAVSVANPEGPELPERYEGSVEFGTTNATFWAMSTIRPPGTPVLNAPVEYDQLVRLLGSIGRAYPWNLVPGVSRLNFEFKKTAEGLSIKQVRPVYTHAAPAGPVVLPETVRFETFQGGETPSDLESSHELKSIWEFQSNGWLPMDTSTSESFFDSARVIYVLNGKVVTNTLELSAAQFLSNSTEFSYIWNGLGTPVGVASHEFEDPSGNRFNLQIQFPSSVPSTTPFLYPSDLLMFLQRPGTDGVAELTSPFPALWPRGTREAAASFTTNGVTVETRFTRTVTPAHALVGLGPTENLAGWKETVITGLSSDPIVLKGYFSQTYKPSRHNFVESFLFEPRLEEGISNVILNELKAADIQRIRLDHNRFLFDPTAPMGSRIVSDIQLIGLDGTARPVPTK